MKTFLVFAGLTATMATGGCSINQMVVEKLGDALSESGTTFTSDPDPALVREAIPFGLKTYESLLASTPNHRGLLLASANGFTAYAYLLQLEADRLDELDYQRAREQRKRATKLYLRGRDYALRGLEVKYPGLRTKLVAERGRALSGTDQTDVPYLYWAGAGWAGALAASMNDPLLIAEVPLIQALVNRVLVIDEGYNSGAIHEFLITFEGSRPGGSLARAREHYRQALEHSDGRRASVHLALAEVVAVQEQDLPAFRDLLAKTLAVDVDAVPELRLVNTIAHERAEWLATHVDTLFLTAEEDIRHE